MAIVALSLVLLIATAVVALILIAGGKVSARDVSWLAAGSDPSLDETTVYARYLQRHRRHRIVGGLFGSAFAIVVGIAYYGRISIGIGDGNPLADILFCALAGILIGSFSAETFRLSEPESPVISASLLERTDHDNSTSGRIARALVIATVIGGVLVAATDNGLSALSIGLGGVLAMAVTELTKRAIRLRRRPVLSDSAREVDLNIRAFAARSTALLQLAAAVLVAAWSLSKAPTIDNDVVSVLHIVAAIGSLVVVIVLLKRAAPRPPRTWSGKYYP